MLELPEIPALVYVSEISHNLDGHSYFYGGGYYRRGHFENVEVVNGDNVVFDKNISNESQETNIKVKKDITKIVVNIKEYGGQKRLLMRSIRIFGR